MSCGVLSRHQLPNRENRREQQRLDQIGLVILGNQVDRAGGEALRRLIEQLDVKVMTSTATTEVKAGRDGRVGQMRFSDGGKLPVDVVVFATGVRPRDELAREAGLEVHERGGIIADETCRTSDESIYAVGEVAFIADRIWGLVGPGYSMAEVVVDRLLGAIVQAFLGVLLLIAPGLRRRMTRDVLADEDLADQLATEEIA